MNLSSDPSPEQQTPETEATHASPPEASPIFREFEERLARLPTPEEKIMEGILFMRTSISQEGTPRFREFWEARKRILPIFKENIEPTIRSKLWGEYVELTVEARRLKEILEEQSAFATEQIDLAIQAMEGEITNFATILASTPTIEAFHQVHTIREKVDLYNQVQRELNLLNTLASRLNGLRKEIIKTEMRMRFKTKFFKRLSAIGDSIFPKRKQLIEQISGEFQEDVEQFVVNHFRGDQIVGAPYFVLREEIKALQGLAKVLTLSSAAFNKTRLKLSECWDKIKVVEKEHKKEIVAKKQASSENRQVIEKKIEELGQKSAEMSLSDLENAIGEISAEMRQTELARQDVFALRDQMERLRAPHLAAQAEKTRAIEEAEREKLRIKREKIAELKEKAARILKEGAAMEIEALEQTFAELKEEIKTLSPVKTDQQQFDRLLRQVKDLVSESKERSLLNLNEGDRQALENLKKVLEQKKQRRQEVKEQVEHYRRALGSSNLDFEKAMQYRELMDQEKELLEKANHSIAEIEQKIAEFEG